MSPKKFSNFCCRTIHSVHPHDRYVPVVITWLKHGYSTHTTDLRSFTGLWGGWFSHILAKQWPFGTNWSDGQWVGLCCRSGLRNSCSFSLLKTNYMHCTTDRNASRPEPLLFGNKKTKAFHTQLSCEFFSYLKTDFSWSDTNWLNMSCLSSKWHICPQCFYFLSVGFANYSIST